MQGKQPYNELGDAKNEQNSTLRFRRRTLPKIREHSPCLDNALDLGCGNGRLSAVLAENFRQVHAIDTTEYWDSRFDRSNLWHSKGDIHIYQFTYSPSFDTILLWGTFYLNFNKSFLPYLRDRYLSNKGIIVIGDDQKEYPDGLKSFNELIKPMGFKKAEPTYWEGSIMVNIIC